MGQMRDQRLTFGRPRRLQIINNISAAMTEKSGARNKRLTNMLDIKNIKTRPPPLCGFFLRFREC